MVHTDPGSLARLVLLSFTLATTTTTVLCQDELSLDPTNLSLTNPCDEIPPSSPIVECPAGQELSRSFYNKTTQSCHPVQVKDCYSDVGFADLDSCQGECMKRRPPRRLPTEDKYGILSDFEMTAPKKLNTYTTNYRRRKFPTNFCGLQWDSGLICPGFRREERRRHYMDQFYYDDKTNSCHPFVYNGCGGNANRFFSLWECNQSCGHYRKAKQI